MTRRAQLTAVVALALVACELSVQGTKPVDPPPPPPPDAGIPEASLPPTLDAGDPDAAPLPRAVKIAGVGKLEAASGLAQQTHVVYAENAKRWVVFTLDGSDTKALRTFSSADFLTWEPGATLVLPYAHAGHGGDFSVVYGNLGGVDVVHVAIGFATTSADRAHYHVRATIAGAAVTFGLPAPTASVNDSRYVSPWGVVTALSRTGIVQDYTGLGRWSTGGAGNEQALVSLTADTGATFGGTFTLPIDISLVPFFVHARAAVPFGASDVVTAWENGDAEPSPSNVSFSRRSGTTGLFTTPAPIFVGAAAAPMNPNDWSLAAVSDADVHAVRRVGAKFEHTRYDGAAWVAQASAPPDQAGAPEGGVAIARGGPDRLVAVTITAAPERAVAVCEWKAGVWGRWATVEAGPGVERRYPAASASDAGGVVLLWSERAGDGSATLVAMKL